MLGMRQVLSLGVPVVCVHAYQSFRENIPNGFNVRDCEGAIVPGVGHLWKAGAEARNEFGYQFAEGGPGFWFVGICMEDSDGDGMTNGEELGDPNCVWEPGQTPEFTEGITHPGLACGPSPAPPQDIQLSGFGAHIEGVSVDPWGNLYATHFRGTTDNSSSGNNVGREVIGRLKAGEAAGGEAWYSILPEEPSAAYNGMKWTEYINDERDVYVYVADVGQGKVMKLHSGYAKKGFRGWEVHCSDPSWTALGMPNDLAVSQTGLIFLSGQDWGSSTGALWLCRSNGEAVQLEGNMGRTNGVALSPDGATLYLTEAKGSPVSYNSQPDGQRIWKYSVAADGSISQKTEFFNFATDTSQPEASTDSDGMRTDASGNLYVTRNGLGKVAVITPAGDLLREITLSKTNFPTNLDFSPSGDLLYVVGRCGSAPWSQGDGCMEVVSISDETPPPAPTPTPAPSPCTDDNDNCEYWASVGECEANPGYMLVNCRKSCAVCSPGPVPTPTTAAPTPTPAPTPAPATPVPTPQPTAVPTPQPTPPPTPQPTPAPAASCCKWAGNCGGSCTTGWCASSQANCKGCGGNWCAA